jgi:predicted nucleic acid-binding protein
VPASEALSVLSSLLALPGLHVLPTPVRAVAGWMDLLKRRPVTGANVFDLQIVATVQANGVRCIYTYNTADFAVFSELKIVNPSHI